MKRIAVILAGGSSKRLGSTLAKPYLPLNGMPMLRHAILAFLNHPQIDAIQCVIRPQDQELYQQATQGLSLLPVAYCGVERQQSVFNALVALEAQGIEEVLIHDAARPLVEQDIITKVIAKLAQYNAVDVGMEVIDTIKMKDSYQVLDRNQLYATQTPQGFKFDMIYMLHKKYASSSFTDDIAIAILEGEEIGLVQGSKRNFKITTMDDYYLAQKLGASPLLPKVGFGFDIHAFSEKKPNSKGLMLAGINVPFEREFIAHSDGDVVLHALTDAILGALGEEDIGMYFPPSEAKWRGMASDYFLNFALSKVQERGGIISNVDINIVAEKPKLMEHKDLMRKKIAELLKINNTQVSVKAKTSERLGFVGREEGISVSVVCMLLLPEIN